ncbi:MAG: B12-binding domain-containing radical SAM protein [Thermodesulfobacteriota bacterium]
MDPELLLINPWIYDFAAYDLWARPLGLLYLAARLKAAGWGVRLVDCLDRGHPGSGAPPRRAAQDPGTGRWRRETVPLPGPLTGIPRRYARYGLPEEVFRRELSAGPRPDLVLVTSGMTYWYPGVHRAIGIVKETWPGAPVVLGGTYATLCFEHAARKSGADAVAAGPAEESLAQVTADLTGLDLTPAFRKPWSAYWPDLDWYPRLESAPLLTSRGCPFRCPYCASNRLYDRFETRTAEDVLAEVEDRRRRLGIADFAFFDDALLVDADQRLGPLLEGLVRRDLGLRLHAPNGLHVGLLTRELAGLMKRAGFATVRLGVESLEPGRSRGLGGKVDLAGFLAVAGHLKAAGFGPEQIGGYLLFGLPGQDPLEVLSTARTLAAQGVRPYLAEYSPLPGTELWEEARQASPFDLAGEPLYHNNSIFPCRGPEFSWERLWAIKRMVREVGVASNPGLRV